jgi:hypothetical protein
MPPANYRKYSPRLVKSKVSADAKNLANCIRKQFVGISDVVIGALDEG